MKIDQKFWFITRDKGKITKAGVRYFEIVNDVITKKLDTKIFTTEDFGDISTEEELIKFLN